VGRWIAHASPTVEAWREGHPVGRHAADAGASEVDQLAQVNVAMTIDTLRRELGPERSARVEFVGLYFRVADATVWMLRDDRFVPLTDAEMVELAGVL
jgi:carbonic anhydrase